MTSLLRMCLGLFAFPVLLLLILLPLRNPHTIYAAVSPCYYLIKMVFLVHLNIG
jgi:hypothetical protein